MCDLACDRHVCIEIRGGMHGCLEVGRLAHNQLALHLKICGYELIRLTPGLWMNKNGIAFTLAVDNFEIKCKEQNIQHLINALKDKHAVTINMSGSLFYRA